MAAVTGRRYTTYSVLPASSHCHFVLLDNDESCTTTDRSNIGRPDGQIYSTGELLNTPLDSAVASLAVLCIVLYFNVLFLSFIFCLQLSALTPHI